MNDNLYKVIMDVSSRIYEMGADIQDIVDNVSTVPENFRKYISVGVVLQYIKEIPERVKALDEEEKAKERAKVPVKQFLFVEDGSVDTDEITKRLAVSNPETCLVVYRQGSRRPEIQTVEGTDNDE